jgi:peroxiredoxin
MRPVVLVALLVLLSTMAACSQQPPAAPPPVAAPSAVSATPSKPADAVSTPAAANPTATESALDDAKSVMRQLADFYRQAKTFRVDFDQKFSMDVNGRKNAIDSEATISVERPNRLAIRNKDTQLGVDVVCDGEQLSMSMAPMKQYTQTSAPKTLDELLANPLMMMAANGRGPLLNVFAEHPYEQLMEGVTNDEYVGREKIGEVEAHHLKFENEQMNWEIWVAAQDEPRLLQASFDLAKAMAAGGFDQDQLANMKVTSVQHYNNWQFDAPLAEDAFAFEPPDDAKKVDSFFAGMPGEGDAEKSPLLGKPAPAIEQELLGGGHFSLKERQSKKVILLDFWATWCGPCVKEMPVVAKVVEQYGDKDVALYCVNQREDTDTIRAFLEETKLDVNVILDADGDVGTDYGVSGIPVLVLIDKAGIVQSVHVGFSPDLEETLKQELDALLAGKDLGTSEE